MARLTGQVLAAVSFALHAGTATAGPETFDTGNSNRANLRECVTAKGVREHQAALQASVDANIGTRPAFVRRSFKTKIDRRGT